jgi:YD repeat-containing protein
MYIQLAVAILATLQPLLLLGDELPMRIAYQSDSAISNKIPSGEKSPMSDREKAGLRGPVQQCTEGQIVPAFENIPAATYTTTTKYSPEGRILQSTTYNSVESGPPEFSTTYTYDSAGLLIKKTVTNPSSPASEAKYNYDEKARIISITDPLRTSTFEYDDKGRRSRAVSPGSESEVLLPASAAYEFPVPEDEDPYLPIPAGGQARISYNEQDHPLEWKISDANGNLVNRLIRTYDEHGRVSESRYTIENILLAFPSETQQQFLAESGVAEELARQFTKLLGEQHDFTRTTYKYDAEGRLTEKHAHLGPSMEIVSKIAYNDHSDKTEEETMTIGDPNPSNDGQPSEVSSGARASQESKMRYSYKYDGFGNWTEQRTSSAASADDANVIRRTLIYYSSQSLEAETALSSQRGPGARFLQRTGSFFGLR